MSNLLKELLTLKESRSKEYLENVIDKAIKLVDAKGMTYEDAVDAIADKAKEIAAPDEQILDTDMLIDMIKAVYDDELNENEKTQVDMWRVFYFLPGSSNPKSIDIANPDNLSGQRLSGFLRDELYDQIEDAEYKQAQRIKDDNKDPQFANFPRPSVKEDEQEPAEPVKPKLLGRAGDYSVMLDDDEEVCLYYEDKMITSMPLVIWKQLTKI
jgi:hypothetical protein